MRIWTMGLCALFLLGCNYKRTTVISSNFHPGVALSNANSTVSVSNPEVLSGHAINVTVYLKDTAGAPFVSTLPTVTLQTSGGTSTGNFGSIANNGDGSYTSILTGGTAGTTTKIQAMVNGLPLTSTLPAVTVIPSGPSVPTLAYSSATGIYGVAITISPSTLSGNGSAITNCASSPALPGWATLNATTCVITGTPDALQTATSYTITATNAQGPSTGATLSLTINASVPTPILSYAGSSNTTSDDGGTAIVIAPSQFVTGDVFSTVTNCVVTTGGALPGGLSLNPSNCEISGTPSAPHATSSYTITATNAENISSVAAAITLTVTHLIPVATTQSVTIPFDTATAITLAGTTSGGTSIVSYSITSGPSHGSLSGTAPNLTYTPAVGYKGADSFAFKVNDGIANSNAGTVSISVSPLEVLHTFQALALKLQGSLVRSGNKLYGLSSEGGINGNGTIFSTPVGGGNAQILYSFKDNSDGVTPQGSLIVSGNKIYGMTKNGGDNDSGTIFSYDITQAPGSGVIRTLYSFRNVSDGTNPQGSLIISGDNLYGMTSNGGDSGSGTIFSYDITQAPGSGVTRTLYSFRGGSDGTNPQGSLIISGDNLYGMTSNGGDNGSGVIFSYDITQTLGSGVTSTLYSFTGGSDGANPQGSLIISGDNLYGMTSNGGDNGVGVIFSYDITQTLGSGVATTLFGFTGGSDGANPQGSLIISGNNLYGMASNGGDNGGGVIFSYDIAQTPGSGITSTLYSFTGGSDGANPQGDLILSGSTLYGMTPSFGADDAGVVFSYDTTQTPGSGVTTTLAQLAINDDGGVPEGSLTLSGSILYGMTSKGGLNGFGEIFSIPVGGGNLKVIYSFTGGSGGAKPQGSLILSGTTLYGMTTNGGAIGCGLIFSYDTTQTPGSGVITRLSSFTCANGVNPIGSLILSGNKLYGMTLGGGTNNKGVLFSYDITQTPGSGVITKLYSFTGSDGQNPFDHGSLLISGNILYGMTTKGGNFAACIFQGCGVIFSYDLAQTPGSGVTTTLYRFAGGSDGSFPLGSLIISGNNLYGVVSNGGDNGSGKIFSYNITQTPGSGVITTLYNFIGHVSGRLPTGTLLLSGNNLYGMTSNGGDNDGGAIFSYDITQTPGSGDTTTLYRFSGGAFGSTPNDSLVRSGNVLYGMTKQGGVGSGVVFGLHL